ncbi:hypothetical protein B0H16DRAFT_1700340 [Mycena metata]|uniref:Uncharacterized protein n=1 Tax=Mycena metata TaxID=1033252 RepID=A0AAD7HFK3_9AGAR|nr:hypothetical protein B0H16DRAFT_1701588 [Mycena metata]KAJ7719320.1 hypothetical protein B0H16DRAFT_1700340 [Mycena metata]
MSSSDSEDEMLSFARHHPPGHSRTSKPKPHAHVNPEHAKNTIPVRGAVRDDPSQPKPSVTTSNHTLPRPNSAHPDTPAHTASSTLRVPRRIAVVPSKVLNSAPYPPLIPHAPHPRPATPPTVHHDPPFPLTTPSPSRKSILLTYSPDSDQKPMPGPPTPSAPAPSSPTPQSHCRTVSAGSTATNLSTSPSFSAPAHIPTRPPRTLFQKHSASLKKQATTSSKNKTLPSSSVTPRSSSLLPRTLLQRHSTSLQEQSGIPSALHLPSLGPPSLPGARSTSSTTAHLPALRFGHSGMSSAVAVKRNLDARYAAAHLQADLVPSWRELLDPVSWEKSMQEEYERDMGIDWAESDCDEQQAARMKRRRLDRGEDYHVTFPPHTSEYFHEISWGGGCAQGQNMPKFSLPLPMSQRTRRETEKELLERLTKLRQDFDAHAANPSPGTTKWAETFEQNLGDLQTVVHTVSRAPRAPPPLKPSAAGPSQAGPEESAPPTKKAKKEPKDHLGKHIETICTGIGKGAIEIDDWCALLDQGFNLGDEKILREIAALERGLRGLAGYGESAQASKKEWRKGILQKVSAVPPSFAAKLKEYSAPLKSDGWLGLLKQNRLLETHMRTTRAGEMLNHVYEVIASIDFIVRWNELDDPDKTRFYEALFAEQDDNRAAFEDLDAGQRHSLITSTYKKGFSSWKKACRKQDITPRNRMSKLYHGLGPHMVLEPLWCTYLLHEDRTSTFFAGILESLLTDIPSDPDNDELSITINRYPDNWSGTVGILHALDKPLALQFVAFMDRCPSKVGESRLAWFQQQQQEEEEH